MAVQASRKRFRALLTFRRSLISKDKSLIRLLLTTFLYGYGEGGNGLVIKDPKNPLNNSWVLTNEY